MSSETTTELPSQITPEEKAAIKDAFELLKAKRPGFKARGSQNAMIGAVASTLAAGGVAAIQAPTGTGKSLGYLAGALPIAMGRNRCVIIGTGTVALQEQLFERDVPAFLAATGIEAKVALAKGRGRYACTRNLFGLSGQGGLDFGDDEEPLFDRPPAADDIKIALRLADALQGGAWDGDMDRAPESIPDGLRPMITTSSAACSGSRCSFASACPFLIAKKKIESANLVVANHDLILADLRLTDEEGEAGGFVLPEPATSWYIIDEAHNLAEKAIQADSHSLYVATLTKNLPKIRRALANATKATATGGADTSGVDALQERVGQVGALLTSLAQLISHNFQPTEAEPIHRFPLGRIPQEIRDIAAPLAKELDAIVVAIRTQRRKLTKSDADKKQKEKLSIDLGMTNERVSKALGLARAWALEDDAEAPPYARWIAWELGALILHAAPTSGAAFLASRLYPNAAGVVLTSATLAAGNDFAAIVAEAGIPDDARCMALPSPFNLAEQGEIVAVDNGVEPNAPEFPKSVAAWLEKNLDWGAGTLVLFTSKKKMQAAAEALAVSRRKTVLVQGDMAKGRLLDDHRKAIGEGKGSVLFGLASFGEGLDLPGDLCTSVVITQLPFSVPTEPIPATMSEWLESKGRNPFVEISVPAALITLTQWAGRLIRTETDRGRIVILDRRLRSKAYGRRMLQDLPPFTKRSA